MTTNIAEIINIANCNKTLDEFSKIFGIKVSILDKHGSPLILQENQYCNALIKNAADDHTENCNKFEKEIISKVSETKEFVVTTCWCGINTLIAPIIINNKCTGFIKATKFITQKIPESEIADIAKKNNIDSDYFAKCMDNITIIPEEKLNHLITLLTSFTTQICNNGIKYNKLKSDVSNKQTALIKNTNKLKLALETMNFGVFEMNVEEMKIYFDEHSLNILDMPKDSNGIPKPIELSDFCTNYLFPEKVNELTTILSEAINSTTTKHFVFQFIRSDKELRWVEIDTFCLTDESTGQKKLIGLYRDITDRNAKEFKIAQQNISLQHLTLNKEISSGNLNSGFYEIAVSARNTLDVDNICFWLYDSATDYLTGYEPLKDIDRSDTKRKIEFASALELLTHNGNTSNLISINDVETDRATLKFIDNIFKPFNIRSFIWAPLIVNREFKGVISCEMAGTSRKWMKEEGDYTFALARITASAFEIKDRIRAQEDLSESQKLAHVSHFSWDIKKNTIHGSDEYYRIFEINPETNKTLESTLKIIHPGDRETSKNAFSEKNVPQSLHRTDEFRLLMNDGRIKYISRKIRYILNSSKKLVRIIGTIQDITKTKESEIKLVEARAQAEAANKSKSDFLANMSHEIRTPLNIILGMIDLALDTEMTSTQYNYLHKASNASKSLLGIINDILDFSKVEAGKLSIENIPFNVKEITENVISTVSISMESTRFELILDLDTTIPKSVYGDPLRVNQVITNLLSNAIKFTNKGEVILKVSTIEHTAESVTLLFSVSDTGIGMSDEQQEKLFKSFNQADASITRKHGGTGLGLAISKQLINLMGSDITLSSELGIGSTFSFKLKFKVHEEENSSTYTVPDKFKSASVLIVDDNKVFSEITSKYLTSFGFKTDTALSGSKALSMIDSAYHQGEGYNIVLLNWDMPGVNGIETAEALIKKKYSTPPKILMTISHSSDQALNEIEQLGIHRIIVKPVIPLSLLNTIVDSLDNENHNKKILTNKHKEIPDFSNKKILLVEDNAMNQEIATALLKKTHANISVAYNGLEGVGMARSDNFDLILMDVQMPIMDGLSSTRAIRKFNTDTPIIAMTAHAISGDKEKSLDAGMNDHITKPISPKALYAILSGYILNDSDHSEPDISEENSEESDWGINVQEDDSTSEEETSKKSSIKREIDIDSAIKLLDNDKELYIEVLSMFINDYSSSAEEIKNFYNEGKLEDAHRIAHTFKGIAGNIGAPKLKEIATNLDLKFKSGDKDLEADINIFCQEIKETVKLIEDLKMI